MPTKQETETLYDVVIYRYADRQVVSVVGERLQLEHKHNGARRRYQSVLDQHNMNHERYSPSIVEAGTVKVGDILPVPS